MTRYPKERKSTIKEVAQRLGVGQHSFYGWKKKFWQSSGDVDKDAEIRRLKKELARVTEACGILKKRPRTSPRMQSEARICRRASSAFFGEIDVSLSAHPSQRLLCLAESAVEPSSEGRCPSDRPYPEVLDGQRQGVWLSQTSRRLAGSRRDGNLEHSMSRRGNCHDNAVAESFFNLLKRERIRRRTYKTRAEARQDVFDYIEMFYNPKRKYVRNGMRSPVEFERQQKMTTEVV
jgi:hypothetical protein